MVKKYHPEMSTIASLAACSRPRPVRSYVLRQGRITPAQQHALETCWETYGIAATTTPLDIQPVFGRVAPCVVEIGFGMGQSLIQQARQQPENNFLGIEVHRPGVGSLLAHLHQLQLNNVRVICADAHRVFTQMLYDNSLAKVQIFFPDPWPKKRHHKRRLLQQPFLALVARKLQANGLLHIATDWQAYADAVLTTLRAMPEFTNTAIEGGFAPRAAERPLTKFEQRGQRLGHGVWELVFRRAPLTGFPNEK